jgi:hypothetical protein
MSMPKPRKPIYLITASVFFVGCSVSQATTGRALATQQALQGAGTQRGISGPLSGGLEIPAFPEAGQGKVNPKA